MSWRFWRREETPEPEKRVDESTNPEFDFDALMAEPVGDRPVQPEWLSTDEPAPSAHPPPEDTFDMSEIFTEPFSSLAPETERDPEWIAQDKQQPDQVGDLNMGNLYTRANPKDLKRKREQRERHNSFSSRAKRGELGADDIPGRNMVSNAFFGFMAKLMAPIEGIFASKAVIMLALGTALLFWFMAFGMINFAQWQFGSF